MEWCFVVTTASGNGEVRVRDNGDVVHTAGSAGWVSLDGISFPAGGAVIPVVKRNDLLRIDGLHEYAPPIHNHIVAHYTKPRTAIDFILQDGSPRLGRYKDTKDPRESKNWLFTLRCVGERPAAGEVIEIRNSLSRMLKDSARVLCFSSDTIDQSGGGHLKAEDSDSWTRPRMWEQYPASHSGVALLFDRAKLVERVRNQFRDARLLVAGNVLYLPARHATGCSSQKIPTGSKNANSGLCWTRLREMLTYYSRTLSLRFASETKSPSRT